MKTLLLLTVSLVTVLAAKEKYSDKNNIDFDEVLNNERLFINHFNCIMDKGPCTPEAAEFKRLLPEALNNGCQQCSEYQTRNSVKLVEFMKEKKPEMWKEVEAKYDPEGVLTQKFLEEVEKHITDGEH